MIGSADALDRLGALTTGVAQRVFPTLTEPLRSRAELQRLVADDAAWEALFEAPLSRMLESSFDSDLVRGIVATDALIGTFAALDDPGLLAEPLLPVPRDRQRHGTVGHPGRRHGGADRCARRRGPSCRGRAAVRRARRWRSSLTARGRPRCTPRAVRCSRAGGCWPTSRRPCWRSCLGNRRSEPDARGLPAQAQPAPAPPAAAARLRGDVGGGVRRDLPRQRGL